MTCISSSSFSKFYEDDCLNECPENTTIDIDDECFNCQGCLTCIDGVDVCTSCDTSSSTPILDKLNNKCVSECPANVTIAFEADQECEPCSSN